MTTENNYPLPGGRMWLGELFALLAKTRGTEKKARVQILRDYAAKGTDHAKVLKDFCECLYHPGVVMDLPEGDPPFNKNPAVDYDQAGGSLFQFFNQRYILYFVKGMPNYVENTIKREQLYVRVLESLFPAEANLLNAMKDKDDKSLKNFNEGLVREAFPDWLPPKQNPTA